VNEIKVLAEALNKNHRVTIACLSIDGSYRGLAFSYSHKPVRVNTLLYKDVVRNTELTKQSDLETLAHLDAPKSDRFDDIDAYEFYGYPADAVSIMLTNILAHRKPDLVICGIHNGIHIGQDVFCSSNIAMAMEASFFGVPAIAVGTTFTPGGHSRKDLVHIASFIEKNVETFAKMKLPEHTFLDVLVPIVENYSDFKGVKITELGWMKHFESYIEKTDSAGEKYYWADRFERVGESGENAAWTWFKKGFISVTPVNYDATCHESLSKWNQNIEKELKAVGGGKKK
jgi:5'-nucleotidase